jgi:hypothetical protein
MKIVGSVGRFKKAGVSFVLCIALACTSCKGQYSDAASDLEAAFQSGCSIDGTYTEVALGQTASLETTIQDLKANTNCAGINSELTNIQNLNVELQSLSQDPIAAELKSMEENQKLLLLQISQATDPNLISILTEAYSTNAAEIASYQGEEVQVTGSPFNTPLQRGYSQLTSYLGDLTADSSTLSECAKDNPLIAAQLAAGIMATGATFASPAVGSALAVAGNVLNDMIVFAENKNFNDAIDNLNMVSLSDSLSCGLESMSNVYCEAQDLMDLTHLQECSYNPKASPDCPPALTSLNSATSVKTTQFWKGLDILSRELPAFQLWVNEVVSGVAPADPYGANRQNDPASAQAAMDQINRLAEGWETQQTLTIDQFQTDADKHVATVRALSTLVSVLAYDSTTATSCTFGNCNSTPILNYYQSASAILYSLVGQPLNCVSNAVGGNCEDANTILLPGDTQPASGPRVNGNGGWETIKANEANIYNTVYNQVTLQLHQAIDVDPSGVLESAKIPAGVGLVDAYTAMKDISAFLQGSSDYYTNLPDSAIDGGQAAKAGILQLLAESKGMIDDVTAKVIEIKGNPTDDEATLTSIYNTLRLAQDPDFIHQRITLHVQDDINMRIQNGDAPSTVDDILRAGAGDAASQLTQVSSDDIDGMYANLGNAQMLSRMNVSNFVGFFTKSLNQVITMIKASADKDGEPIGGNPRIAPFRSSQARICILIASTQSDWPSGIDPKLCQGTFYESELTGESIKFDDLYAQMKIAPVSKRICTFANFYKTSARWTREQKRQGS